MAKEGFAEGESMTTKHHSFGLYTPDDTLWQVNREVLLILSGARAVLLEVAHPLIAAGVANHSDYRRRPLKRLFRTVRAMQLLSFGTLEDARQAAKRIHLAHRPVKGTLAENVGPLPEGTSYDARDPELELWVFATVVDSILVGYDLLIRPLSDAEKAAYYEDSKRMAHLLGVPPQTMPHTYADFRVYMDRMTHSDVLAVGDLGRDVASGLFTHRLVGPLARVGSFCGIGLLPEHLREAFGFRWGEQQTRWLERIGRFSRWLRPKLPDVLLVHPRAWWKERRYRRGGGGDQQA
jgi:uncharacterized protein (DUF2236 family)